MPKSRQSITCGDFNAVRQAITLTGIAGEWIATQNHCQFRAATGAVLNYWKTTGTIIFQGPDFAAAELKAMVLQRAVVVKQQADVPV